MILMKSRLILNPTSGSDTGTNHLPTLNERLRERVGALDIVLTTGPDDTARAAADAAQAGYGTLFVAGGTGP